MCKWGEDLSDKKVSKTVIKRLPRYYRYLSELQKDGIERISSGELSNQMQVTASQIRQDLNNFGGFGQQGYGYNVSYLRNKIGSILGLNQEKNVIIIGAGNLGKALSNYSGFEKHGFKMLALFDNDDSRINESRKVPIYSISKLGKFLSENDVSIAALTVPKGQAEQTAKTIVEHGIKGIWNFAQIDLDPLLPDDVVVQSVHLIDSLMELSYNLEH